MIRSKTTYRIVSDHLGSPRLVVDVATGAVAQEFGRITLDTNPGFQPFGFAGGLYDPATGLVRFGARDYDPEIGRWTAPDPIGFGGGLNLYLYAFANPLRYVDASGLDPLPTCVVEALGPYFADVDWDEIDLELRLPRTAKAFSAVEADAVTLGENIYMRKEAYDTSSYDGMALLGHEVVHVEQSKQAGGKWKFWRSYIGEFWDNKSEGMSNSEAYNNISYEAAARKREAEIREDLKRRFPDDPSCGCG